MKGDSPDMMWGASLVSPGRNFHSFTSSIISLWIPLALVSRASYEPWLREGPTLRRGAKGFLAELSPTAWCVLQYTVNTRINGLGSTVNLGFGSRVYKFATNRDVISVYTNACEWFGAGAAAQWKVRRQTVRDSKPLRLKAGGLAMLVSLANSGATRRLAARNGIVVEPDQTDKGTPSSRAEAATDSNPAVGNSNWASDRKSSSSSRVSNPGKPVPVLRCSPLMQTTAISAIR
jgi:hypothetical protein